MVPLLVLATAVAVSVGQYRAAVAGLRELAERRFAVAAAAAADRTRVFLDAGRTASETLAADLAGGRVDVNDRAALVGKLAPVLRARPELLWVSFTTPDGRMTGLERRTDAGREWLRLWATEIDGPVTRERYFWLNDGPAGAGGDAGDAGDAASWELIRTAESDYDPRTRPFYVRATAAGTRVWTEPYAFFPEGTPGVTAATPIRGRGGAGRGAAC